MVGHCGSETDALTDEEWDEIRAERMKAIAKKKPLGFTAKWEEEN